MSIIEQDYGHGYRSERDEKEARSNDSLCNLFELYAMYKWDADIMRCRRCGRGIVASRIHEVFIHAHGCLNDGRLGAINPWDAMRRLIT
jgi:hypothetical protein